MDREIEILIKAAMDEQNFRKMRRNGMFLSNYQINLLEKHNIPWQKHTTYRGLLFDMEEKLMNDPDEELDILSQILWDQSYYHETRK